jgi:hypothetical protein
MTKRCRSRCENLLEVTNRNSGFGSLYLSERGFSASSRVFDLNGEAKTARTKYNSSIIPPA